MPKGISFNIDTNDKRMSRVFGNAIKLDLDIIEILTSGGKLKYSPTHMEFVSIYMNCYARIVFLYLIHDQCIIGGFMKSSLFHFMP